MTDAMPSAIESERQVLGMMMLGRDLVDEIVGLGLQATDFYASAHSELFGMMRQMAVDGEAIDAVTVMQGLKGHKASGEELLEIRDMVNEVFTPAGMATHVRRVKDAATLRALMMMTTEVRELASNGGNVQDIAHRAEELVYSATERQVHGQELSWPDTTAAVLERMEYMAQLDNPITGIATGYKAIDHKLFGLQEGNLYYVAARPGVGKTSFASGAALRAAQDGHTVAFFSLEMSAEEIAARLTCTLAEVSYTRLRRNRMRPEDWTKIVEANSAVSALPIHVYDSGVFAPIDMLSRARRVPGLELVIVDYVQLAKHHTKTQGRNEEVSEISRSLKLMARDLKVPVLAAAQLNREVEHRKGPPKLSDLRDSGSLEQDGDVIVFLHRSAEGPIPPHGAAVQVILAKNRHGETGTERMWWEPAVTRFRDLSYAEEIEAAKDD